MEDPTLVPASEMRGYQNTWNAAFIVTNTGSSNQIAKARRLVRMIRIRPRSMAYEGMKR